MSSEYERYLASVAQRLSEDKFQQSRNLTVGRFKFDLFGYKRIFSFTLPHRSVCYVSFYSNPNLESTREYSAAMYEHGIAYQPTAVMTCLVYPVLVSLRFDEETKRYVRGFDGKHKAGIWYIEHTTLLELESHDIFHYEKKPFLGGLPERVAIRFANQRFKFS